MNKNPKEKLQESVDSSVVRNGPSREWGRRVLQLAMALRSAEHGPGSGAIWGTFPRDLFIQRTFSVAAMERSLLSGAREGNRALGAML